MYEFKTTPFPKRESFRPAPRGKTRSRLQLFGKEYEEKNLYSKKWYRAFRGGIISTYFYPQNMNMLNQSIYPLNTVIIKTNLLKFVNIFTEKGIIV